MKDLAVIQRRIRSRIPEDQTGLAMLDATVTGTKTKELETKLHRLVIGQEEAIHEIVRTYQTYLAGLSPEGRPKRLLVHPLSNLMASGQIQQHDRIRVTYNGESPSLTFFRETDAWETWKTNGVAAA